MQSVSFVIPSLNEKESLPILISRINDVCKRIGLTYEIIVVDDGSTDGSFGILKNIKAENQNLHAIQLRKNFGKSVALTTGFEKAQFDTVIMMDADLQDDPEDVPKLLEKINEGYDAVTGWKVNRQDPWHKTFPSKIFNGMARMLSGVNVHDVNCGLKAFRKVVVDEITLYGELYRFILLLADAKGFKVTEIPTTHHPRVHGRSKFGFSRFLKGFFDLCTVYFLTRYLKSPLHFFGAIGLLLNIIGSFLLLYLVIIWFAGESIGNRPLLLFAIFIFLVGIQLFISGFLGEMITAGRSKQKAPVREEF